VWLQAGKSELLKSRLCLLPDGVAALSWTGPGFSGAVVLNRVRNGKNGVTSNGIFSDAVVKATALVLINSI